MDSGYAALIDNLGKVHLELLCFGFVEYPEDRYRFPEVHPGESPVFNGKSHDHFAAMKDGTKSQR